MGHDREETKRKILGAVGKVLARDGFQKLGVNSIAREAGVDKVLIYRYFDNLPTLLKTFAQEGAYVGSLETLLRQAKPEDLADWPSAMVLMVLGVAKQLKGNPLTQEIFRWELTEHNELTADLASSREALIKTAIAWLREQYPVMADQDLEAISAMLLASVTYLVLRAGNGQPFMGIDLNQTDCWQRLAKTLRLMAEGMVCAVKIQQYPNPNS
jgi:AcrR family transcriptional regulator